MMRPGETPSAELVGQGPGRLNHFPGDRSDTLQAKAGNKVESGENELADDLKRKLCPEEFCQSILACRDYTHTVVS